MRIRTHLIFNITFCFLIQSGFCESILDTRTKNNSIQIVSDSAKINRKDNSQENTKKQLNSLKSNNLNDINTNNIIANNINNTSKKLKSDKSNDENNSHKKNVRIYSSLMFTEKNIKDIFKALPTSSIGIPDQFINSPFANDDSKEVENSDMLGKTSFSVYLNSIMYISKNDWAVWINGNKITNLTNGSSDISIVKISPLHAIFVWKITSTQWDIINEKKLIPETEYKKENGLIYLYFALNPNQTYLPVLNKTLEGNLNRIIQTGQIDVESEGEEKKVKNTSEQLFF